MSFEIIEPIWTTDHCPTVVSYEDPALDAEATGVESFKKYLKSFDESHLTFRPGLTPTRFKLRPLDPALYTRVRLAGMARGDEGDDFSPAVYTDAWKHGAFLAGVVEITGLRKRIPGGWEALELTAEEAALKLPDSVVKAIGDLVVMISRPPSESEDEADVGKPSAPNTSPHTDSSSEQD